MIYMTHPLHGAMHVYTDVEVALNEKNGWVRAEEPVAKPALAENVEPIRKTLGVPKARI